MLKKIKLSSLVKLPTERIVLADKKVLSELKLSLVGMSLHLNDEEVLKSGESAYVTDVIVARIESSRVYFHYLKEDKKKEPKKPKKEVKEKTLPPTKSVSVGKR